MSHVKLLTVCCKSCALAPEYGAARSAAAAVAGLVMSEPLSGQAWTRYRHRL